MFSRTPATPTEVVERVGEGGVVRIKTVEGHECGDSVRSHVRRWGGPCCHIRIGISS
jgi:hypothetical protein